MTKGQWMLGAMMVAAGFVVGMCGRNDTPVPSVKRPEGMTGPSTTEEADPEAATRLAELQRIPEPGATKAEKKPDGQIWDVYDNGIGVQVIKPGNGASGRSGMRATVAYTATLADTGEVVEKYTKDHPLIFTVSSKKVMRGLSFVLFRFSAGACGVWLPPEWAYGEEGLPPEVKPNQTIILDMEFIRIAGAPLELPETKPAEGIDLKFLDTPVGPTTAKARERELKRGYRV